MDHEELLSLAECVGATPADLIFIARLVAGDDRLLSILDLTPDGCAEAASYLRTAAECEVRPTQAQLAMMLMRELGIEDAAEAMGEIYPE